MVGPEGNIPKQSYRIPNLSYVQSDHYSISARFTCFSFDLDANFRFSIWHFLASINYFKTKVFIL